MPQGPGLDGRFTKPGSPQALGRPRGYTLLFSFKGKDGSGPLGLTAQDGLLYGTTSGTGHNGGTFFSLATSDQHVLLAFKDRYKPTSALTSLNGLLYGMSCWPCGQSGPSSYRGLIFSLSTSGQEQILHRFSSKRLQDGFDPNALTVLNGMLYGTTQRGGDLKCGLNGFGCGTVFSLSPSGDFHVLYRFRGTGASYSGTNGVVPTSILAFNGKLYGTTYYGGTTGNGTVFSLTTAGKHHLIYSFKGHSDGALPNGVIVLDGKLYGTTYFGGDYYNCVGIPPIGCGTVFSITTSGRERILHSFGGGSDGANPMTGLTALNGKLYGTTGNGILFSITTTGTEKPLLSLSGCSINDDTPCSVLTPVKGTLYGTTPLAGAYNGGTAYAFKP
jgi:uncharacterized repeat protein (TIGR03803 family)